MAYNARAVWQGFDVAWARTPHRLNDLGAWIEGDGPRAMAASRLTVGRVPDLGVARVHVAELGGEGLSFVDGQVELTLSGGPGERVCGRGSVALPLLGADPASSTVLLRGFDLVCSSHPAGVHAQALSVRVVELRALFGVLVFEIEGALRVNHSPDPLTRWRGPWRFTMTVPYTVVLAEPGALATTRTEPASVSHDRVAGRADERLIRGRAGYGPGVLGVEGFRFDLVHEGRWRKDGRYLRRFHSFVEPTGWRAKDDAAGWRPRTWFSNDGLLSYPLRAEHALWTVLLQPRRGVAGPSRAVERRVTGGIADAVARVPLAPSRP